MEKKSKLYFLASYGQLGNQLASIAHLLAFAAKYNYIIVYPKLDYFDKFLNVNNLKSGNIRFSKLLSHSSIFNYANKIIGIICLNRNRNFFQKILFINTPFIVEKEFISYKRQRSIVVTNWFFRYYDGVKKYQNFVRDKLSFNEVNFNNARQILLTIKNNFPHCTLVGIHVRRGDYKTWIGGKYFYSNAEYYAKMKCIASQLDECLFIIVSNEELIFDDEENLNIIYAKGSSAEDIFLLSHCKYILGPPSTFSSWAAFLGNQDLLFMETKDEDVSLDRFNKYFL